MKPFLFICLFLSSTLVYSDNEKKDSKEVLYPKPNEVKERVDYNPNPKQGRGMHWGRFQLGGGMMMGSRNIVRGAALVSWTPTYQFGPTAALKSSVGVFFRNATARDSLRVSDFYLTIVEKPKHNSPLFGELGGGFQYWTVQPARKFYPQVKAAFGYQFGNGDGPIKNFHLNYSYVIHEPLLGHQLLGVFSVGF